MTAGKFHAPRRMAWARAVPRGVRRGRNVSSRQKSPHRRDVPDTLFLLEHDPVYTIGRTPDRSSCSRPPLLPHPVETINRGGQATYHGPGQLVGYPVLDLGTARARFAPLPAVFGGNARSKRSPLRCARRTARGTDRRLGRRAQDRLHRRRGAALGERCTALPSTWRAARRSRRFVRSRPAACGRGDDFAVSTESGRETGVEEFERGNLRGWTWRKDCSQRVSWKHAGWLAAPYCYWRTFPAPPLSQKNGSGSEKPTCVWNAAAYMRNPRTKLHRPVDLFLRRVEMRRPAQETRLPGRSCEATRSRGFPGAFETGPPSPRADASRPGCPRRSRPSTDPPARSRVRPVPPRAACTSAPIRAATTFRIPTASSISSDACMPRIGPRFSTPGS